MFHLSDQPEGISSALGPLTPAKVCSPSLCSRENDPNCGEELSHQTAEALCLFLQQRLK